MRSIPDGATRYILIALPIFFMTACGRHVTDIPKEISYGIGLEEKGDRDAMLDGQILNPPRDYRPEVAEDEEKEKKTKDKPKTEADETVIKLLAEVVEKQDKIVERQNVIEQTLVNQKEHIQQIGEKDKNIAAVRSEPWQDLSHQLAAMETQLKQLAKRPSSEVIGPAPPPRPANQAPSLAIPGEEANRLPAASSAQAPPRNTPPVGPLHDNSARKEADRAQPLEEAPSPGATQPPPPSGKSYASSSQEAGTAHPSTVYTQAERTASDDAQALEPPKPKAFKKVRIPKVFSPEAKVLRTQAREAYQRIIYNFPHSEAVVDARMGLAQLAEEDAQPEEALNQYEALIRLRPDSNIAQNARLAAGLMRMELEDWKAAQRHFYELADHQPEGPNTPAALLNVAVCQEELQEYDDAILSLQDVMKTYAGNAVAREARLRLARLYIKLLKTDQARAIYHEMKKDKAPDHDDFAEGSLGLARAYLTDGKGPEARQQLKQFLEVRGKPEYRVEAFELLAQSYLDEEKLLHAATTFAEAADRHPDAKGALPCRLKAGDAFLEAQLLDRAVEQYQKALTDTAKADREIRRQVQPQALLGLTRALRKANQHDLARKNLLSLHREWPDHPLSQAADLEEAEILVRENRHKDAVRLLTDLARVNLGKPIAIQALLRKAEIEDQRFQPQQAIDTYLDLGQNNPSDKLKSVTDLRRAISLVEVHREDEALRVLRRMAGDPYVPVKQACLAHYHIGVALERIGQVESAIANYRRFFEQYKDDEKVKNDKEIQQVLENAKWKADKLRWLMEITAPKKTETPSSTSMR